MLILVVDDETVSRTLIRKILDIHGFQTKEASNGIEALQILESTTTIDLVILDYLMPHMNGVELLHQIKLKWPTMASILLTGYPNVNVVFPAVVEGIDRVLSKPVDMVELVETIKDIKQIKGDIKNESV